MHRLSTPDTLFHDIIDRVKDHFSSVASLIALISVLATMIIMAFMGLKDSTLLMGLIGIAGTIAGGIGKSLAATQPQTPGTTTLTSTQVPPILPEVKP